ncbi:hypothetical protein AB5I41_22795 [Sphingomonas sp. MMS24-JH45]
MTEVSMPSSPDPTEAGGAYRLIAHVEAPLEAYLGSKRMTVADLTALKPGESVALDAGPGGAGGRRLLDGIVTAPATVAVGDRLWRAAVRGRRRAMWWMLASGRAAGRRQRGGGARAAHLGRAGHLHDGGPLAVLALRRRLGHRGFAGRLPRMSRAIEVVEMRRLGVHADVGLVRHRGRDYLLVVQGGGGGVTVLDARDASPSGEPAT